MRYFDTSFLVPIFIGERFSAQIEKILAQQPAGEMMVSFWTLVEFTSSIARQVRMGDVDRTTATTIERDFEAMVSDSFVTVPIAGADFDLARRFMRQYETGLRSGDALHLAVASNHDAQAIYTLDTGLVRAGRILGLPVKTGIRLS